MKKNLALAVIGLSLIASSGAAITLEDVAGIYIGKVTRTSFDLIEHLDQVTAIYPGGGSCGLLHHSLDPVGKTGAATGAPAMESFVESRS